MIISNTTAQYEIRRCVMDDCIAYARVCSESRS